MASTSLPILCFICCFCFLWRSGAAAGCNFNVVVDSREAIALAGRTDMVSVIPPCPNACPALPTSYPLSLAGICSTNAAFPKSVPVVEGQILSFGATGCIIYAAGGTCPTPTLGISTGPEGDYSIGLLFKALTGAGSLSGFSGPLGALVGVFLDNNIPNSGSPPPNLDFLTDPNSLNYLSLSPLLGQVFFIGDGIANSVSTRQQVIAPTGSTRLFFGIYDSGSNCYGGYDNNFDSSDPFQVCVNVTVPPSSTGSASFSASTSISASETPTATTSPLAQSNTLSPLVLNTPTRRSTTKGTRRQKKSSRSSKPSATPQDRDTSKVASLSSLSVISVLAWIAIVLGLN